VRLAALLLLVACTSEGRSPAERAGGSSMHPPGPQAHSTRVGGMASKRVEPIVPYRPRLPEAERIDPADRSLAAVYALAERCDSDHHRACWLLGDAWERGEGSLEPNEQHDRRLYRKACRFGAQGCVDAARLHTAEATNHLRQGCENGDAMACRGWAERDEEHADEARRRGCALGWVEACEGGERIAACQGPASRCVTRSARMPSERAVGLLRHVCNGEVSTGCLRYGEIAEDADAARAALRRACDAGLALGCATWLERMSDGDPWRDETARRVCALDAARCEAVLGEGG